MTKNQMMKLKKKSNSMNKGYLVKIFKSLTFKSNSLILGDPCYNLKSLNAVSIDFDLLKNNSESLQYQLIHCDKDWKKSNINSMDAIDGFDTDYIENKKYPMVLFSSTFTITSNCQIIILIF